MNRRGLLSACLAACAAPAIVRAGSIMKIAAPAGWSDGPQGIWTPWSGAYIIVSTHSKTWITTWDDWCGQAISDIVVVK